MEERIKEIAALCKIFSVSIQHIEYKEVKLKMTPLQHYLIAITKYKKLTGN